MFARSVFCVRQFSRSQRSHRQQRTKVTIEAATRRSNSATNYLLGAGIALCALYGTYSLLSDEEAAKAAEYNTALNPNKWQDFVLDQALPVNHNTKIFRFKLDDDQMLGLPIASCLLTKAPIGKNGTYVIRPYTPISGDTKGYFDLLIKEYPNGNMSKHIHSLGKGDKLSIKGPILKIPIHQNKFTDLGMVAGGTGITPMLQVIKYLLEHPYDRTKIWLVYGSISEDDIIAKDEIEALRQRFPHRFRVYYTLDNPPEGWTQGSGYMTKDMLKRRLPPPGYHNAILVCGPKGLVESVSGPKGPNYTQGKLGGILKDLGYLSHMVYKF